MTSNIYPARVKVGSRTNYREYKTARVRTNRDETRIQVWVLSETFPHRPECVVDQAVTNVVEPYKQFAPLRDRHAQWRLGDGSFVHAQSMGGCGCGSPLKVLPQWDANKPQAVGV